MSWMTLKKHYGFESPFDFRIVIPFLLSALALTALLVTCIFLFLSGRLYVGTERFYFLVYLALLLVGAATFSKNTCFSIAALVWFLLEAGISLTSSALEKFGTNTSLVPANVFSRPPDTRFVHHALLQRVPKPNWQERIHYDERNRGLGPYAYQANGTFWNQDLLFVHNSLGLRGSELTEIDLEKPLIFIYGGSSTYDYTVTQGKTWTERLGSELDGKYAILNFGVPGHSTTEHLIHTAFYQAIINKKPTCAIYYVGWNDISKAHIENLDRAYANFHSLGLAVRKPEIWPAKYSPLLRLLHRQLKRRFDSIPEPPNFSRDRPRAGTDAHLEQLFVEHIATLVAINRSRGIKTVFIGQIMNRDHLNYISQRPIASFPFVRAKDIWPLQEHFNSILRATSVAQGAHYIDPGVEHFKDSDFADIGHFSADGSRKFATLIAKDVDRYCQ